MQECNEVRMHSTRKGSFRNSLHRLGSSLTAEDASTVIGICVGILIVLAGVLTCITCFSLLITLAHDLAKYTP
jgi:hypothetical protein